MRPGTVGGENAINDFKRVISAPTYATPGPDIQNVPETQPIRPPKAKRQLTNPDFRLHEVEKIRLRPGLRREAHESA